MEGAGRALLGSEELLRADPLCAVELPHTLKHGAFLVLCVSIT